MGRIVVQTKITNLFDEEKFIRCGMLVDTGAGALILPSAWKERLGDFKRSEAVELLLASREVMRGEACGPVEIRIEGFRPVSNERSSWTWVREKTTTTSPSSDTSSWRRRRRRGHARAPLVPVRYIDMK